MAVQAVDRYHQPLRRSAGLRVRLNERGKRLYPRSQVDRVGTIERESHNGVFWFIKWDGQAWAYPMDKRLVEVVG